MKLTEWVADEDTVVVGFEERVRALSSTIVGGGLRELTHVVFHRVDPDFDESDPAKYARGLLERLALPKDGTAVFLTAVDVVKERVELHVDYPAGITLVGSVGLGPTVCIGGGGHGRRLGTINLLLFVEKCLTDNALVDLAGVVWGAKALALVDLGLSKGFNLGRVYATATDALVVASATDGEVEIYGGPATPIGAEVAGLVYEAILSSGLKGLSEGERFRNVFGVDLDWVSDTASELYLKAPIPGLSREEVRREVEEEVKGLLKDPNVWALALAARDLDWHGLAGALPGLDREEYLGDSHKILADELLGIALALYVNGWKGLFAYYWIDSTKEGLREFEDKPMFMDDILASLVGSVLSRLYDRHKGSG